MRNASQEYAATAGPGGRQVESPGRSADLPEAPHQGRPEAQEAVSGSEGMETEGPRDTAGKRPGTAINRAAAVAIVAFIILLMRVLFGSGIWPYVGWSVVAAVFLFAIFRGPSVYRRHGYRRHMETLDHKAGRSGMNRPEDP